MLAKRPIRWASNHTYDELSPLKSAEDVSENLLERIVVRSRSLTSPGKKIYPLYTGLIELGIRSGDQSLLKEAKDTYEAFQNTHQSKIRLANHGYSHPFYVARSQKRLPTENEVVHVKELLWAGIKKQKQIITDGADGLQDTIPGMTYSQAIGQIGNTRGLAAESISLLLGIYGYCSGQNDILMASSAREEAPEEAVMATVGIVKHDVHSYNQNVSSPRGAIGIKVSSINSPNLLPEFRLEPAARIILQNMTGVRPEPGQSASTIDIISLLEQAETDNTNTTFSTIFRNNMVDALNQKTSISQQFQTSLQN